MLKPDQSWQDAKLKLEDGGCITAGLVSRKAASDVEIAALLERIGDDPER